MALADALWREILVSILQDLAANTADEVAKKYVADATQIADSQKIAEPEAVIRAAIQMVEDKQGWDSVAKQAGGGG